MRRLGLSLVGGSLIRGWLPLLIGIGFLTALAVWAGVEDSYRELRDGPGTYRSSITSDDSLDLSGGTLDAEPTLGNQSIAVQGVFSVNTAVVTVHLIGWDQDASVGTHLDEATLTADSAAQPDGTNYNAQRVVLFDSYGWVRHEIRVTGIASGGEEGSVDLQKWSFGARTEGSR